jgi:hypothetical protein
MTAPGRRTNLALFAVLGVALATGAWSFATGASAGRWVIWAHGIAGLGVVVLAPWKARIARRGFARRRPGFSLSIALAVFVVVAVAAGVSHSTGVLRTVGPVTAMQVHVGAALVALPLAAWHVIARPAHPRVTDLSRRTLLRTGLFVGASTAAYLASEGLVRGVGLPGAERRFTGSFEKGSFDPAAMPITQWLNDAVPEIDGPSWRLVVAAGEDERSFGLDALMTFDAHARATLDCTGGWFAEQEWTGIPLSELIGRPGDAQSVLVRSATGYQRRFSSREAGRLLLATTIDDRPLSTGHGYPLRLVAPGRRGFWWVKWVERIEVDDTPWWWQPPFPVA